MVAVAGVGYPVFLGVVFVAPEGCGGRGFVGCCCRGRGCCGDGRSPVPQAVE